MPDRTEFGSLVATLSLHSTHLADHLGAAGPVAAQQAMAVRCRQLVGLQLLQPLQPCRRLVLSRSLPLRTQRHCQRCVDPLMLPCTPEAVRIWAQQQRQ